MHHFDTRQDDAGATKILEPEHGAGAPLDRAVVLLDDVVQVLRLADRDWCFTSGIDGLQRGQIGATFVDRHRPGFAITSDRCRFAAALSRWTRSRKSRCCRPCRRAVQILPLADSPALADRPFAFAECLFKHR